MRRAIPGVLERIGTPEAAAVLAEHLLEGDATLRLRILVALVHIRDQQPGHARSTPAPLEAALGAEVLGHYRSYQILGQVASPDPGQETVERGLRAAMREELERIFRLLDLLHPRRDFRSAWAALRSGNAFIHDQALDLLDSALRPDMKALLVPARGPRGRRRRSACAWPSASWAPPWRPRRQAVAALAGTGDPWLRSCAAYAIGARGLHSLEPQLEAWSDDPDPLLRETVRQARAKLAERAPRPDRRALSRAGRGSGG